MRRRATIPALFAVVALVVGQLVALAHESTARHIICEEHGELIEAARLAGPIDGCEHDHWIGVEGGGHDEDCAIARALRQSTTAHEINFAISTTTVATTNTALAPRRVDCCAELYLIAPKTSPPAA